MCPWRSQAYGNTGTCSLPCKQRHAFVCVCVFVLLGVGLKVCRVDEAAAPSAE